MFRRRRTATSHVKGPESRGDFQRISISGYIFRPDEVYKLLEAYEQVKEAPKILLDLSKADWLTSIGVAAIAKVVAMSLESPGNQKVYSEPPLAIMILVDEDARLDFETAKRKLSTLSQVVAAATRRTLIEEERWRVSKRAEDAEMFCGLIGESQPMQKVK